MAKMCLVVTPEIRKMTENIMKMYPEASQRGNLTPERVAEWIGAYNTKFEKPLDFVPEAITLVNEVEKWMNWDGKSFLHTPHSVTYNLPGQAKQIYTIIGDRIHNKDGKVVFSEKGKHRNRIFANLAVQNKKAVVVEHQNKKYVVNNKDQIISVTTGDEMMWDEENGDRKAIIAKAREKFEVLKKTMPTTASQGGTLDRTGLVITPTRAVDKKAAVKGSIANKFIGFAEGIQGSSTAEYAKQAGDKANVGEYDSNDIVFVSIPGIRGNADNRHTQQDRTIAEALKALDAGATLITDNKTYTLNSQYNEGEKRLAQALTEAGAAYYEEKREGHILGMWKKETINQQELRLSNKEGEEPHGDSAKGQNYESALQIKDNRMRQFHRTFTPQQMKDRGVMIARAFSWVVDTEHGNRMDALKGALGNDALPESTKAEYRAEIRDLLDPVKGRQLIVQKIGVPFILNAVKKRIYQWHIENREDSPKTLLAQNTLDYFEDLFNAQASIDIEEREGIRIVDLQTVTQTVSEEENSSQDIGDDEIGHIVSGSDGWSFEIRFSDPFSSLSKKVKAMLCDIKRPESDNDDLGLTRYYPLGQMYATILSYFTKHVKNADDFMVLHKSADTLLKDKHVPWGRPLRGSGGRVPFDEEEQKDLFMWYPSGFPVFPALEEMAKTYPWVSQIIDTLTDDFFDYGEDNIYHGHTFGSLASQFYTTFRKEYIPYGKIQLGQGKAGITPLNYDMEDRIQYDKLVANYNNRLVLSEHSVYDSQGKMNMENVKRQQDKVRKIASKIRYNEFSNFRNLTEFQRKILITKEDLEKQKELQPEIDEMNKAVADIQDTLASFGISMPYDTVARIAAYEEKKLEILLERLWEICDNIERIYKEGMPDNFDYILDTGQGKYKSFLSLFEGIGIITDDSYRQSFYDFTSRKTKYNYSADNYLMKVFRMLASSKKALEEHYGKYEWFRNQKTGEWRNKWLEKFYKENILEARPYKSIDSISEYNDKTGETTSRPYNKWTPDDIWQVQSRSYNYKNDVTMPHAWYLTPIFSDSPMSMIVKGPKLSLEELKDAFVSLVKQEMWRMKLVMDRKERIKEGITMPISNFDGKRGKQFCFIPELNSYTFKDTGEKFIDRMVRMKKENAQVEEVKNTIFKAVEEVLEDKRRRYYEENNSHYENIEENMDNEYRKKEYFNMVYANAAIIQITTVDLAFYKSDTEFQKRFKEVYSGGIELNTNSRYGKKTENVLLLMDDVITSPSYNKIAAIIDGAKNLTEMDKDHIKKIFREVNVADAQAFRSMHSYRSVLDMMGNWTLTMEESLNRFKDGTWNREDFDTIYQAIKPFVYTVIDRNDGFGGTIPVPQQNKNSEICALMMYDVISNGLKNSDVYKALSEFMEETRDANGEYLVDMVQFESAGKVGNQGVINISIKPDAVVKAIEEGITLPNGNHYDFYPAYIKLDDKENGKVEYLPEDMEHSIVNFYDKDKYKGNDVVGNIKDQMDEMLDKGEMPQEDYNAILKLLRPSKEEIKSMLSNAAIITNPDGSQTINPEVVHTIPFANYYQQQPTPEHHLDAKATFGSQARNIVVADLPDDVELVLEGKGGTKKLLKGKDAIVDFYYELLNENLIEDFFGKGNKKGLKGVFASKESLREAVTEVVRGNPKYGQDFVDALQIENGQFVLSPNSPTMFNLMQEIITSFFKNRITRQTINGAALIQAAGIGLDEDLRLLFNEDGSLKGAECYMPLTTKKFFEPLLVEKEINGKVVQVLDFTKMKKAGLDTAVGYRIPTENKSSMMPLIIKGFTPTQNGSAIVLPAEITAIAGSDFDVDKMFVMLSSFSVQTHDKEAARKAYEQEKGISEELRAIFHHSDLMEDIMSEAPEDFNEWFAKNSARFVLPASEQRIYKIKYDFSKSPKENGMKARNNLLIQMMYGILTSNVGSESVLNPQGFEDVKRAAKTIKIIKNKELYKKILQRQGTLQAALEWLATQKINDVEDFIKNNTAPESPIYPQTFAQSHAKNMAGANQIGIYAIQGSMAAKYQRADVRLRPEQQFKINGRIITNVDVSDGGKRLKNVGQMIGASADNGKDPNLSDMGSTSRTAPIIGYMLRAGLSHLEAALVINQPAMDNANFYPSSLARTLPKGILYDEPMNVTTEMLVRGIVSQEELSMEERQAIDALCYRILLQCRGMEYINKVSRADSPNGAMQHTYAKARLQQYRVDLMQAQMGQKDFPFVRIKEAISNDAVDTSATEETVREQLKSQKMGFLQGMYALGINSFQDLVSPYFFGAQKWFDEGIVKPILYNLSMRMHDSNKEQIIENIYRSYISYMLSGSPLFSNTDAKSMRQRRREYLVDFPKEFRKTLNENKDIQDTLGSILSVIQDGNRQRIVLKEALDLSNSQRHTVQRRLETLLYMDNPLAQELAEKLFVYSYYDNGLHSSSAGAFSHLFSTGFITSFATYTDTLNRLGERLSPEEEKNFIAQFLLTYPDASYKIDSFNGVDEGHRIIVDLTNDAMRKKMVNVVMSPNPQFSGINVYPYVSYNGNVYILNQDAWDMNTSKAVYDKVERYATYQKMPLFSRQMSVVEMAQQFPFGEDLQKEKPSGKDTSGNFGDFDSMENFAYDDYSLATTVDEMDDLSIDLDTNDLFSITEENISDIYSEEGKGELREPFC